MVLSGTREPGIAMVATLGGKPQIVTFALDALMQQGVTPRCVYALHLAPDDPSLARSLALLRAEFEQYPPYQRAGIRFESFAIRQAPSGIAAEAHDAAVGQAITRVDHPSAADAIWLTTHRLLMTLKAEGYVVYLLVTGGPRLLGLQALSAASLLFDLHDECLHLYTPPELRERAGRGELLHRCDTDPAVRLVRVPLLPIGMIAPLLREAARATPEKVLRSGKQRPLSIQDEERARQVLARLSPRLREVLHAIVQPDATYDSACRVLHISRKTLESHLGRIFIECRRAWEDEDKVDKHFLREKFGSLLSKS